MSDSPEPAARCACLYPPPCPVHEVEPWVPGTPLPRRYAGPSAAPFLKITAAERSFDIKGYGLALMADIARGKLDPRRVAAHLRGVTVIHKGVGGDDGGDRKRLIWETAQMGASIRCIPPETKEGWEYLETVLDEYSLYRRSLLAPAEFKRPAPDWLPEPLTRPMSTDLPWGTFANSGLSERYRPRLEERQAEWDAAHPDLPRYDSDEDYERATNPDDYADDDLDDGEPHDPHEFDYQPGPYPENTPPTANGQRPTANAQQLTTSD